MKHHSKSGRIVVDVDPKLKRKLYAALALSGDTLKEWFVKEAGDYSYGLSKAPKHQVFDKDNPKKIKTLETGELNDQRKLSVVSLFSGCGGMDLGFQGGFEIFGNRYNRLPFEIIWANDLNPYACSTYKKNIGHEIHVGDIWSKLQHLPSKADVVIGGFPCQDISVNGKRAGANGAKSGLYKAMVETVKLLKPKVFVAENVKGLLMKYNEPSLRQVIDDFQSLGYNVQYQLYNAADFGVPQTRERVFIIGTRKGVNPFLPPLPKMSSSEWLTAAEAISDLEDLPKNPAINHIWSLANVSGEQGNRKLKATRPGYTIRAECHGNIQFHYSMSRRISMREAARFQSFPDKFIFDGGLRETERQIGNAVPPVLAWHVANAVYQCFCK